MDRRWLLFGIGIVFGIGVFWHMRRGLESANLESADDRRSTQGNAPPPSPTDSGGAGGASGLTVADSSGGVIERLDPLPKTEEEWRRRLSAQQFSILRRKGTERAFTGAYWNTKNSGVYCCAGCGHRLFSSEHKFDSGTGWPSFYQPIDPSVIAKREDNSLFSSRTEVLCQRCNGHLGHVFEDGPRPTGLRYCLNSAALKLDASREPEEPSQPRSESDDEPSGDSPF